MAAIVKLGNLKREGKLKFYYNLRYHPNGLVLLNEEFSKNLNKKGINKECRWRR